jgi:hypothetical protein
MIEVERGWEFSSLAPARWSDESHKLGWLRRALKYGPRF